MTATDPPYCSKNMERTSSQSQAISCTEQAVPVARRPTCRRSRALYVVPDYAVPAGSDGRQTLCEGSNGKCTPRTHPSETVLQIAAFPRPR